MVFEPLASSAATLLQEEKQVGVVLLDIGGGTTDIAVYSLGSAIYTATIPVGGNVLTSDISLGLKTTLAEAEDVKKRFGAAEGDTARVLPFGRSTGAPTREHSTADLRQIVVPRVLETLRMAKQKIVENVPRDLVLGEVVLTGGGAQLPSIESARRRGLRICRYALERRMRRRSDRRDGGAAVRDRDRARSLRRERRSRRRTRGSKRRGGAIAARVQRWLSDLWT